MPVKPKQMILLLLLFVCRMADNCSVPDVLSNGDTSLDSAHVKTERKQVEASELACVLCGSTPAGIPRSHHLKLLPCLHVTCEECLVQFLLGKSLPYKDDDFAAAIFACPCCSYSIQLSRAGVSGLKDASFLQTAVSSAVSESATTQLSESEVCRQHTGMPLLINDGADDGNTKDIDSVLSLRQSLPETDSDPKCAGISKQMFDVSSVNNEERSDRDTSESDGYEVDDVVGLARSQISRLSLDVSVRQRECEQSVHQMKLAARDLDAGRAELHRTITQRANHLCQLICSRRDQLLSEVDNEQVLSSARCTDQINTLAAYSQSLHDSSMFAGAVLAAKNVPTKVEVDVVARLNQLILCDTPGVQNSSDVPQITAMRLDVPDVRHEEAYVDKLYGSLVNGTIGTVEFLNSFNTELQWPTGFVVTHTHDSVLAGKAGAFSEEGWVLFYNCHGTCVHRHPLVAGHLPVDVVTIGTGDILVSDVSGQITKFTSSGRLVEEWSDVFWGPSGHMAVNSRDELLITSAGECCIHRYHDGQRLASFSLQWPDNGPGTQPDITAIAVNSHSEIIVTASNFHGPYFFDDDGQFLHSSSIDPTTGETHIQNGVKTSSVTLPSALCCDAFDNVLIADFVGNCVHLLSRTGLHLGRLLTKTYGVACPNFLTLDQDGRLYVGQYGGDVLVFRYMSYVKHV